SEQLLTLEELLGVVVRFADALVFDAVHKCHALRAVDGRRRQLDELLRIALEVIEPAALYENSIDAAARELRLVLKVGEDVGQIDVPFIKRQRGGSNGFLRIHARTSNGKVGFA